MKKNILKKVIPAVAIVVVIGVGGFFLGKYASSTDGHGGPGNVSGSAIGTSGSAIGQGGPGGSGGPGGEELTAKTEISFFFKEWYNVTITEE